MRRKLWFFFFTKFSNVVQSKVLGGLTDEYSAQDAFRETSITLHHVERIGKLSSDWESKYQAAIDCW